MKKFPVANTRTLCKQGALLHALRLLRRKFTDERIAERLDAVYGCGTIEQYAEIIRLAKQGIRAAELLVELDPGDNVTKILIPNIPSY